MSTGNIRDNLLKTMMESHNFLSSLAESTKLINLASGNYDELADWEKFLAQLEKQDELLLEEKEEFSEAIELLHEQNNPEEFAAAVNKLQDAWVDQIVYLMHFYTLIEYLVDHYSVDGIRTKKYLNEMITFVAYNNKKKLHTTKEYADVTMLHYAKLGVPNEHKFLQAGNQKYWVCISSRSTTGNDGVFYRKGKILKPIGVTGLPEA